MKLETRKMIEKKIFSRVVKTALEKGYTLSLYDTEDYPVKDNYQKTENGESIEEFLTDNTYLCGSWLDGKDRRFVFQQF